MREGLYYTSLSCTCSVLYHSNQSVDNSLKSDSRLAHTQTDIKQLNINQQVRQSVRVSMNYECIVQY